jgi:hypothetical protein
MGIARGTAVKGQNRVTLTALDGDRQRTLNALDRGATIRAIKPAWPRDSAGMAASAPSTPSTRPETASNDHARRLMAPKCSREGHT